jgi:hypothetical protein
VAALQEGVTPCEPFESIEVLVEAGSDFFRRYNDMPERVLPIIGAKPALSP